MARSPFADWLADQGVDATTCAIYHRIAGHYLRWLDAGPGGDPAGGLVEFTGHAAEQLDLPRPTVTAATARLSEYLTLHDRAL